jgi:Coenzyme PQQ synthesis protein D (PqqD)
MWVGGLSVHYTTQVPMLVSRQFDDEVILANFETGIYYSLIGTAADIWLGLQSGARVEEIVKAFEMLRAQGTADTKQSITSFIEQLLAEKIIAPNGGILDPQPWYPQFSNPFSPPVLDRFDDLRDLLFLDPVHDVSNAGWPVQAKDGD